MRWYWVAAVDNKRTGSADAKAAQGQPEAIEVSINKQTWRQDDDSLMI